MSTRQNFEFRISDCGFGTLKLGLPLWEAAIQPSITNSRRRLTNNRLGRQTIADCGLIDWHEESPDLLSARSGRGAFSLGREPQQRPDRMYRTKRVTLPTTRSPHPSRFSPP